jgi:hypothetical protein
MEREALLERRSYFGGIAAPRARDRIRDRLDRLGSIRTSPLELDGPRQQLKLFLARRVDKKIDVAALHLRPFITLFARQALCVFLECLVENADHDQPAAAPTREFGHLLEEEDVGILARSALEELSHFVDDENETTARPRLIRGRF